MNLLSNELNFDISKEKVNINLMFYFFLKTIVKAGLSDKDILNILKIYITNKSIIDSFKMNILKQDFLCKNTKTSKKKQENMEFMLDQINDELMLRTFIFALRLYAMKDLLIEKAKANRFSILSKLEKLHPLSLEYDKTTLLKPYNTRVNGALISLIFFENVESQKVTFILEETNDFIDSLAEEAIYLKSKGIESNQIFMLILNESINQSIISDSGIDYEERILTVLKEIGIAEENIKKTHDQKDKSTEFDFFFTLENKTFGIGAKRTLRERYKQFIKTSQMSDLDVMLEITLGTDLTEEKVKSIRNHNVYLFVADEIYKNYQYLQQIDGVYSCLSLTKETLLSLRKSSPKIGA